MTIQNENQAIEFIQNPIDQIEIHLLTEEWKIHRMNDDELVIEVPGQWGTYRLQIVWHEELDVLQLYCLLDLCIDDAHTNTINNLLTTINEHMALGHFEVDADEAMPIFRYGALLTTPHTLTMDFMNLLMGIAVAEADRFYPAFQLILGGGKTAQEAVGICMMDTVGEA